MALKRSPNKKSTEELLKDLESPIEGKVSEQKIQNEDNILTFIRFYNIEPGKYKIKVRYLYQLYKKFTKEPKPPKTFAKALGNYLPINQISRETCFLINQKALNLSEKALKLIEKSNLKTERGSLQAKKHFDNFLNKHQIKPGKKDNWIWISCKAFFNMYDKWAYHIRKKKPLSYPKFRELSKVYFEYKLDTNTIWFKITPFDTMSEEQARNSLNNEKEKKSSK